MFEIHRKWPARQLALSDAEKVASVYPSCRGLHCLIYLFSKVCLMVADVQITDVVLFGNCHIFSALLLNTSAAACVAGEAMVAQELALVWWSFKKCICTPRSAQPKLGTRTILMGSKGDRHDINCITIYSRHVKVWKSPL